MVQQAVHALAGRDVGGPRRHHPTDQQRIDQLERENAHLRYALSGIRDGCTLTTTILVPTDSGYEQIVEVDLDLCLDSQGDVFVSRAHPVSKGLL